MTGNRIRDEGVKAMSEMLKKNTTLTKLCLRGEEEKRGREKEKKEKKNE